MKRIVICLVLTFAFTNLFAQEKAIVISRDTIHLRGYIFDQRGKPIKHLGIESTQLDTDYNEFKVGCYTDTNGYFELKGAKFNDTLTIKEHTIYYTPPFYNKGSRYVVIYLAEKVIDINSTKPVEIKHKRVNPKVTPSFKIKQFNGNADPFEVHIPSQFPGGINEFEEYIKSSVIYPEIALKNNIEGTVQIGFSVERDGSPVNFKILRGIGYGCDQEVINVIRRSPKWKPAIDMGGPFLMKQTVSVKFSLTDN
jgi:TonB family protein